jgi:SAM-dependent methyltransferase
VRTDEREPGLLEHERVPLVSYPYEWTFSMLRDAALLQLRLLRLALDEGMTMKDASPYNVQWRGAQPVFIDVGSFERLRDGEPWAGYRQFCALFLYPLLLQAYKGAPFQPWLRGSLEGIQPGEARALMSARDLLRRGVLTHVVLHSRLERRHAERPAGVRAELREAGFKRELVAANVRRLEKVVRRLNWKPRASGWFVYGPTTSYEEADAARKEAFVREALAERRRHLVWDLGSNDGRFARVAADGGAYVLALDGDAAVVDRLYRALSTDGDTRVLPLVVDLSDPSPARGWRGAERARLEERGRPDLVLCLALLHHLAIARNVPLDELVAWLRDLGATLVVEFVDPADPQAQRLLAAKRPGTHRDYTRERFERLLGDAFEVERSETLASGTRTLYVARPR